MALVKMTSSMLTEESAVESRHDYRVLSVTRLIFSAVITLAGLFYPWGRSLIMGMIQGRPELRFVALVLAGIGLVMALTAGLSSRFNSPRLDRFVHYGIPAVWILIVGYAIWAHTGRQFPKLVIVPAFVLASLWVPWSAWMFYRQWPWTWRIAGLITCGLMTAGFVLLFRVDGVAGEFQVDFALRNAPIIDHGAQLPTALSSATEDRPDLMRTTPDDYPQYMGPSRTSVIAGPQLSQDWTTTPPREVWRIPVGAGWSAFAVVGDFAVTQEQRGEHECVVCYRLSDGTPQWLHDDTARFESAMGGVGPRATPTIADGRVYTVGGTGIFNCLDGSTGQPVWTVNILEDNAGQSIGHGVCGSPLVTGDWVIVSPTGINNACLAAYHRADGKRVWLGGRLQTSYGSPALAELAGSRQVLITNSEGIEGNDLRTGKPLWNYTWTGNTHVNCSQPVIVDGKAGRVLFCTGYEQGSILFDVVGAGTGSFSVNPIWMSRGKMKTKFTTAVLQNGFAYGLDDGILACLDIQTGKQIWKGGRYQHGQILLAGDLLIVQAETGEVFLVKPDPKKLIELGKIPALSAKTWNNPALAGRMLLVRNDREAVCYELPLRDK
jgi:outer membrane protein assembly factor BamB